MNRAEFTHWLYTTIFDGITDDSNLVFAAGDEEKGTVSITLQSDKPGEEEIYYSFVVKVIPDPDEN